MYVDPSGHSKKEINTQGNNYSNFKQLEEASKINTIPKTELNNAIDTYQSVNKKTSPVIGGVKNGFNAFNKSLSESINWNKSSTMYIYEQVGRSSLAKKTFINSVDDFAGPLLKRSSQLSGGIGGAGTVLDALNSGGNILKDVQKNLKNDASLDEFAGDILGEVAIFGMKQVIDAGSLAAGTAGGAIVGGAIGNAPGAAAGATVGGITLPATTGVLVDKALDAKINNKTNKERIKDFATGAVKFGWKMYKWFNKE